MLAADPAGTRQELDEVRARLRQMGLAYGSGEVPISFAPALITESRLGPIRAAMNRLVRLLTRMERQLRLKPWLDRLGVSPEEQELIQLPSGLPAGGYIARVDGFLGPQQGDDLGYRIVELNIDSPGGGAFMDCCAAQLFQTPTWKRFQEQFPGRYLDTESLDLNLLLKAFRDWGGKGTPRLAIVDWITESTASEFRILAERYTRAGVESIVADPRELEFKGDRLLDYDGKPIDLIYRRVLVEDILAHGEAARPLLEAYKAGRVCLVNPFACKPLTVKSLLSLLHCEDIEPLFLTEDLQFMRQLVPWTADVVDGPVLDVLRKRRHELILKPADGYGGEGLYLGWQLGEAEWEKGIEDAIAHRYVAQERVFIPSVEFPSPTEDGWEFGTFRVDFDPYMFGRRMADPLVRVAASDVLNVKAGAQIAVTWVLDGM